MRVTQLLTIGFQSVKSVTSLGKNNSKRVVRPCQIGPLREGLCLNFFKLMRIVSDFLPSGTPVMQQHLQAFSIVSQYLLDRDHRPIGRLLIGEEEYRTLFNVDLLTAQIVAFSIGELRVVRQQFQEPTS